MDCASFIAEWLPSKKPCIYLVNPERKESIFYETLTPMGKRIIEQYYCCNNLNEIDECFKQIMLKNNDVKQEERNKLAENIFENFGSSGEFIVKHLESIFRNN